MRQSSLAPWRARLFSTAITRNTIFATLVTAAFLNFVFATAGQSISRDGLWMAVSSTFGISALIWVAMLYVVSLMLEKPDDTPLDQRDFSVLAVAVILILVPHKYVPVLALSGIAAYLYFRADTQSNLRKAAILLGATTVPLLWGNFLMMFFNEFILSADAFLVSLVSSSERIGNVVISADTDWYIKISRGCSSLSNLSIGVLSWTFFVLFFDRQYGAYKFIWLAAILIPIVIINVIRMAMIVSNFNFYDILHEGTGANIANLITLAVIVGVSYVGIKRPNDPV
jgi:hypothetical protein